MDPRDLKVRGVKKVNQDELQNLANDPRNIVLKRPDDNPSSDIMDANAATAMVHSIWDRVQKAKQDNPDLLASTVRSVLMTENRVYRRFAETHPTFWEEITKPEANFDVKRRVMFMLFMKHRVESGYMTKKQANQQVAQFMLDEFSPQRPTT